MARHQLKFMKLICLKLWLARISATATTATATAAAAATPAGAATQSRQYQHQSAEAQHSTAAASHANRATVAAVAAAAGTVVLQLETVRRAAVTACQVHLINQKPHQHLLRSVHTMACSACEQRICRTLA
jgi:hypothetical protein